MRLCGGGRGSLARCGSHAPHPRPNRRSLRACSVISNPYGLEGIDTDWRKF
jgi:hypothetical protein